jgi:hypothetical protein
MKLSTAPNSTGICFPLSRTLPHGSTGPSESGRHHLWLPVGVVCPLGNGKARASWVPSPGPPCVHRGAIEFTLGRCPDDGHSPNLGWCPWPLAAGPTSTGDAAGGILPPRSGLTTLDTFPACVAAPSRRLSASFLHWSCRTFLLSIFTIIFGATTCAFRPPRPVQFRFPPRRQPGNAPSGAGSAVLPRATANLRSSRRFCPGRTCK